MSRSFRDLLKLSAPVLLSVALLSGCGSGSNGSADLDEGGSETAPPPPVTVTESFDFASTVDWFVVGTPPIHARFSGGTATSTGDGYWIVASGKTGVVEFGTPASAVKFTTQDDFTPTAASNSGASKTGVLARSGNEKVDAPFDVELFVRGLGLDWTARADRKFVEVADNILEVTMPLTTDIVANGEYEGADEAGEFKVADGSWAVNCGGGDNPRITVGTTYTMVCGANPGNLDLTITENADYKFRFDVTGSDKTAPKLTITKVVEDGGGGGGEPEPEDSTIIRIHTVTVFASAAGPAGVEAVEEIKGLGSVAVDKLFPAGDSKRITKIEIVNTGTAGDIGIADFSWTADARYALPTEQVDIYYARPDGSVVGTKIVVGGKTYDCVTPSPDPNFSCVARNVDVTPYANAPMTVLNADGKSETIIFNGGSGGENVYAYSGNSYASTGTPLPPATVSNSAAHWVDKTTVLYNPPGGTAKVEMLFSPDASIVAGPGGIGGTFQVISTATGTNPQPVFNNQLHSYAAWTLQGVTDVTVKDIARGQLLVVARDGNGRLLGSTRVQSAGALDDIYAANASAKTLGVTYASGVPSLAVWAPTALKNPGVSVNVYDDPADTTPEIFPMTLDDASGVWSVAGTADWNRKYYTISLRVFSYATNGIVTNEVTDPYSVSLSMNSLRSQFVNLDDDNLKPAGWDAMEQPDNIEAPEDVVIYELHVRDFSVADSTVVDSGDKGKFTAFGVDAGMTAGRQHLQQLAQAGLTHVHILPAFDIATVEENEAERVDLDTPDGVNKLCQKNPDAASLCATDGGKTIRKAIEDAIAANQLQKPPQIMQWMRQLDGFNWGYDPFHFGVPEGSYSTNPDGPARIREFRDMVMGLNDLGLRTAMDVVYNHTNRSGQDPKSVLDRIVPGYYHRRDITNGTVTSGTCCADTATEFKMMEKLMVDTGKMWVRDYKVSSFRFDLMGTHPLESMIKFRDAVQDIEPSTYIYGEGWNCCGGEDDIRFKSARQANLAGTGIGSFNDRMRDIARGGGPFDTPTDIVQKQGFVSGWFYDPNAEPTYKWNINSDAEVDVITKGSPQDRQAFIAATDNIRVSLTGLLSSYRLQNAAGTTVAGSEIDYPNPGPGRQGAGYTSDPQEAIHYVDKHDNQTFYDYSVYKNPPGTSPDDRVRVHNMGNSLVILAQGIPFLHAGTDIMRSKSGDRDSYDSGDWHNELDWSLAGNKWGQGLPIADKNSDAWQILLNKYLDTTTRPGTMQMQRSFDHVKEMLAIRKSSKLFRLRDQEQVDLRLKFYNTGSTQIPGLVAMGIDGCTEPDFAPAEGAVMLIFNASDEARTLNLFGTETWTLHPELADSTDTVVRNASHDISGFHVPARTTAVFQRASQRSCAPYPRDMFVRGSFNNWGNPNPTEEYKLVFLGGKDYSLSAPIGTAEAHQFKIADAGWSDATNCGVTAEGVSISLGLPMTLTCAGGTKNIGFNAAVAGNYTFSLNATSTVNPVLTVTKSPPVAPTVYVRGGFNGWDPPTQPMTWDGESIYTSYASVAAGTFEFKIATGDWTTLNCGGTAAGQVVTLGQALPLACGGNPPNLGITFPNAGEYVFAVDATDQAMLKLVVEPAPVTNIDPPNNCTGDTNVFVRGLGGDWSCGAANKMDYLGFGTYRLDKAVVPTDAFKIATADWATVNCGGTDANKTVTPGMPFAMACGDGTANLGIATTVNGTYRFKYTRSDNKLLVTGP